MRVFVTGATGLIGSKVCDRLIGRGDDVIGLTRSPEKAPRKSGLTWVGGDPTHAGPWLDTIAGCDGVVHLAGENLFAKRWSPAFKRRCRDSRVISTDLIARQLAQSPRRADGSAKVLVNGSAIGFYPTSAEQTFDEDSPLGTSWLCDLSRDWEAATAPASQAGVRVVMIRTGVVLDPAGGGLKPFLLPFKLFVGGPLGSGQQWMSWIHATDIRELILWGLDTPTASGPYNGVSPNPVRNRDFCRTLGRVMKRPSWTWTPRFVLRIALGEVVAVICDSQKVAPKRTLAEGFHFHHPELEPALRDLLG